MADRWHLVENASSAFLDAVRKSMRSIRAAIGVATINPGLLTCAEKLQYEGYLRREEMDAFIMRLSEDAVAAFGRSNSVPPSLTGANLHITANQRLLLQKAARHCKMYRATQPIALRCQIHKTICSTLCQSKLR